MIKPEMIKWARERANLTLEEANRKLPSFKKWEEGESQPTIKQIKEISKKFYIPFGYLFLSKPIEEKLPIPDFRTIKNKELTKPSLVLLETIYDAQRKQNWLREEKIEDGEDKVIKKKNITELQIIEEINKILEIEKLRNEEKNYEEFLSSLIKKLDENEFLVIRSGIVGNNTRRSLNINEFKGFTLFDEYAPLIFINGKDYSSSQIFTLIHELAHLFFNESGLDKNYHNQTEQKCNKIAAEILLPEKSFKKRMNELKENNNDWDDIVNKIAKEFKVSVFVVLIKAKQCKFINEKEFQKKWKFYEDNFAEKKLAEKREKKGGGDFYKNSKFRAGGNSFLLRVFHSTMSGKTLYREAYSLTGLNGETFDKYFEKQGLKI